MQTAHAMHAELSEIANDYESTMLDAMASHAYGALSLAGGDAGSALSSAPRLADLARLEALHEAARSRVLVGLACRAPAQDSASLELEGARRAFRSWAPRLSWPVSRP